MARVSIRTAVLAGLAIASASAARAQTPMVASTKDFVAAAAQSDHFEILEAQTALTQSHDPRVLAFARQMIQDHRALGQALQDATRRAGLAPPPPGLGGDQQKLLGALQSQTGVEFDRTYAKQQVIAHDEALVVEQAYSGGGDNAEVRQAARSAVPVIKAHLRMAEQLRSAVGGG